MYYNLDLEQWYQEQLVGGIDHDINEHMSSLKELSSKCNYIVEFGVAGGCSTAALLLGNPKRLTSYDTDFSIFEEVRDVYSTYAEEHNIEFLTVETDVTKTLIPSTTDLLFIDINDDYETTIQLLDMNSSMVNKYIAFHNYYAPETQRAVEKFVATNANWKMIRVAEEDPQGMTVLERIS